MSEHIRSQSCGFEAYPDYAKPFSSFDFFINSTTDPVAPHPDLFDSELDSSLAGLEGSIDYLPSNVFSIPRPDVFYGPPSSLTASSDSAYDTVSTLSDSFCNYPNSPYSPSTFSFADLDMDLNQVHARGGSDYGGAAALNPIDNTSDPTSFGTLPPTPPRSPIITTKTYERSYVGASCFSDYSTSSGPVTAEHYFNQLDYATANITHPTVSPLNVSGRTLGPLSVSTVEEHKLDSRKKHKCPKCPRAFARAFNLKTHMATHDPNRLKPHICPHRNCGRSFSRKHDLQRHLTSIHRDEAISTKRVIGVAKAIRSWCEGCGKGLVGPNECGCHDIK
ncbi:hypothetical protein AX17_000170 [Amanita inopinata Kibby_2008]|nr:hypothetical protein AX17_000170 [Amanita inopinata Kibby_2008]